MIKKIALTQGVYNPILETLVIIGISRHLLGSSFFGEFEQMENLKMKIML